MSNGRAETRPNFTSAQDSGAATSGGEEVERAELLPNFHRLDAPQPVSIGKSVANLARRSSPRHTGCVDLDSSWHASPDAPPDASPSKFASNKGFYAQLRLLKPIIPTLVVLSGGLVVDNLDAKMVSGALRALERTLGFSPTDMALITAVQSVSIAFGSPLWGVLSDRHHRGKVLALGSCLWGLATAALACTYTVGTFVFVRFLNGVALASLVPISQSLLADWAMPEVRGTCFGCYCAVGHIGEMLADAVIPSMSNRQWAGMQGWRATCFAITALSLLYAALVLGLLRDPRSGAVSRLEGQPSACEGWRTVLRCKTWLLICFQGIFGVMPHTTFGFLTLWLQYLGFSDMSAGFILSMKSLGSLCGTLCAGMLGDWAAQQLPDHGRVLVAQIADACRVPCLLVLFLLLPRAHASMAMYALTLAILGFLIPFPPIACSRPILCEVVHADLRGSIIAYQTMVECSLGSLGAFSAGRLAVHAFHYETSRQDIAWMDDSVRQRNAEALGRALLVTTTVPWTLCTILYGLVHFTYKHDRDRVLRQGFGEVVREAH